jgi:hypothetical protein
VAISAPASGYRRVAEIAATFGADAAAGQPAPRVIELDLDRSPVIPLEVDVLFWIEPGRITPEHAQSLDAFLARGRSAVLAGSTHAVERDRIGGAAVYRVVPKAAEWPRLVAPYGLALEPWLVIDRQRVPAVRDGSASPREHPFRWRIPPSALDTRGLAGPNAGQLLAGDVSPITIDSRVVAARSQSAHVVATTSEHAAVVPWPRGPFDDAWLAGARDVPKLPWIVRLAPHDRWRGDLVLAGSSTLFHDTALAEQGSGNATLLQTLLRTYTDAARLARLRVPRPAPPEVPELTLAARLAWRGVTVLAVPALLAGLALGRGRARGAAVPAGWTRVALGGALGFLVVLAVSRAWSARPVTFDLTDERLGTPLPASQRLLDRVRDGLEVELIASESLHVPAGMKQLERRVLETLSALGVRPRLTRPEELTPPEREALAAAGIEPFEVETIVDDVPVRTRLWGALRLTRAGRTAVVPRLDARAVEHLEFLLAAAASRLAGAAAPRLGVLSDLPRLSPAEAHADYQTKGHTAPVGSDVYSSAKALFEQFGYEVAHVDPEAPVLPEGMDALVWLQPRFPERVFPQFAAYMARGGRAFVALQHHNIQQRQYRGEGFEVVHWPQPQFHGFNAYLGLLGVDQVGDKRGEEPGEILLDRSHADLALGTQVYRSAYRDEPLQQVSRPFLIRVTGPGLADESAITASLSRLLFIWGSRFTFDEGELGRHGLRKTVLVTTSPRTWTVGWTGGWIAEESFTEPAETIGPQPLAVLLEGPFPEVVTADVASPGPKLGLASAARGPDRPGQLLLVGCSEMFKNAHLDATGYEHDRFLLNAVAWLAHGPELAHLQARRAAPVGLPYHPPHVKRAWRAWALGLGPVGFVTAGLIWRGWRRRPLLRRAS